MDEKNRDGADRVAHAAMPIAVLQREYRTLGRAIEWRSGSACRRRVRDRSRRRIAR
jgi:hypothetical protein